ncbi:MAG: hypothetical protein ACXADB_03615 [Candidatus Hermodarchaeia archaeon]|jgi:hypothetical protein
MKSIHDWKHEQLLNEIRASSIKDLMGTDPISIPELITQRLKQLYDVLIEKGMSPDEIRNAIIGAAGLMMGGEGEGGEVAPLRKPKRQVTGSELASKWKWRPE